MNMVVVDKLPDGIEISQHIREKAAKRRRGKKKYAFFRIMLYGRGYYVPITDEVWNLFGLQDSDFSEHEDGDLATGKKFKVVECDKPGLHDFYRQIIDSVALQLRDNVLDGVEQSVMSKVMDRIEKALHNPLRTEIEQAADDKLRLLEIPEKDDHGEQ